MVGSRTREEDEPNEDVRRALTSAKNHRDEGEFPEAAGWYRRAAKLLLDAGDEDRAIEFARLAADLDDLADLEAGVTRERPDPKARPKAKGPGAKADATGRHKPVGSTTAEALTAGRSRAEGSAKPKSQRADGTGKHKAVRDTAPQPVASSVFRTGTLQGVGSSTGAASSKGAGAPSATAKAPAPPTAPSKAPPASAKAPPAPLPSNRPSSLPSERPSIPMPRIPPPPRTSVAPSAPLPRVPPTQSVAPPPRPPVKNVASPAPAGAPPPPPPAHPQAPAAAATPASSWTIPPPAPRAQHIDYVRARLPSFPGFDDFSTERLREIARQIQVLECDDGEFLFDAAAPAGPMFLITSGSAIVQTDDHAPLKVTLREDAAVGVVSALYGERRLARARARGPLEAFVLAPSLARALAAESPALRSFFEGAVRERALALLPHVSPTLARMERNACMRLLELCEMLTVPDGALLQLEGVAARSLYLVAAGEAELFGEAIAARIVHRAGVGDLIGAESLRDDTPARVTARASRPTMVARLSRANYRRFAAENSSAAQLLREAESD